MHKTKARTRKTKRTKRSRKQTLAQRAAAFIPKVETALSQAGIEVTQRDTIGEWRWSSTNESHLLRLYPEKYYYPQSLYLLISVFEDGTVQPALFYNENTSELDKVDVLGFASSAWYKDLSKQTAQRIAEDTADNYEKLEKLYLEESGEAEED